MGNPESGIYKSDEEREAALQADRDLVAAPLPEADRSHFSGPAARQAALEAAEKANIAQHAGELGVTTEEYLAKKKEVGHTPSRSDFKN